MNTCYKCIIIFAIMIFLCLTVLFSWAEHFDPGHSAWPGNIIRILNLTDFKQ
jgi:hypothetical protein